MLPHDVHLEIGPLLYSMRVITAQWAQTTRRVAARLSIAVPSGPAMSGY